MDWIIFDLNDKFTNAPCEGSGWSLHFLTECVADVATSQKCMAPLNNTKVGTWCLLPPGLRGHIQIKNLQPKYTPNYNCLETCIRLHLSSLEDPEILTTGPNKHRYNTI